MGNSCAQAVGLKYHEDLQHRIPRTEVAGVEATVQRVVREVLAKGGFTDGGRSFVHVTGSYCRGKPDTGRSADRGSTCMPR